jgi:hypothetical protein
MDHTCPPKTRNWPFADGYKVSTEHTDSPRSGPSGFVMECETCGRLYVVIGMGIDHWTWLDYVPKKRRWFR